MKIHVITSRRPKPRMGDVRTTKKHGKQIRIPKIVDGMYVVSSGRQLYEWAKESELPERFSYLLK